MPIPFRPIARLLTVRLHPAPVLDLSAGADILSALDHPGTTQGVLITVNHYHAPDFQAWWFVIVISAIVPGDIHWVVTSGWTDSGWLTWLTHWLFPLGARLLGFTAMPAMPPDPAETEKRASAVRQVLRYACHHSPPIIGLSPEGRDIPGGVLGNLPPGVGRFIDLINHYCPTILPVGIWKEDGIIHLRFGTPYHLDPLPGATKQARDRLVGEFVMRRIAQCLPEKMRGEYR
jgi:hypothetical protein